MHSGTSYFNSPSHPSPSPEISSFPPARPSRLSSILAYGLPVSLSPSLSDVCNSCFRSTTYAHACALDAAVSISNLFPVVYGGLYGFNPSELGLLYLPMLVGSLLAECGTGRAGDKCVAADLSNPLGVLIGRRNASYTTSKESSDVESPSSTTTVHRPGGGVRSDSSKVPEMRLVIALFGILICIVGCILNGFPFYALLTIPFRSVFCGLVLELSSTSTGETSPPRVASGSVAFKW